MQTLKKNLMQVQKKWLAREANICHSRISFSGSQVIAHIPLIESQQSMFKITSNFEHNCNSLYGEHGVCYPVVNACGVSVTFPICHLWTYSDFEKNLSTALEFGYEFSRY
ncbi:hypothetical protein GOODEAATRI_013866 [Goodea atripinnis]|uniref:Uncharacterized protein n=1 Tax=Goodea atripinnis TaxID=208336 RepID=A0ABV0MJL4_9TELE